MYSHRLSSLAAPESEFSQHLARLRGTAAPLLDLSVSNPTEALNDYPSVDLARALSQITSFRYQPEPFGNPATRSLISQRMQSSGVVTPPPKSHIALTSSTSEAYAFLFKLLCNPADEVLVPAPSYPLFDYLAALESVQLRPYRLRYDGSWSIDFETLTDQISSRTRAIVVVNPNNPTGSFLRRHEYNRLIDLAKQHGLALISDEVFATYSLFEPNGVEAEGRVSTLNGISPVLTFTLNGLSKWAGMPQMKLAWIGISGPAAETSEACSRLEFILDTYLPVGAPVQLAAAALLEIGDRIRQQICLRLQRNIGAIDSTLRNSPVHRLQCEGGWSAVLQVPRIYSETEWVLHLLVDQGVIVQPGYFFDIEGGTFLIVSLLTPEAVLEEGARRIVTVATQL